MRVKVVSRGSDLAVLQAGRVARALGARWPDLDVETTTRSSRGDRDRRVALWDAPDKGLFTEDLSHALVAGDADIAVHSWKDLPVSGYAGTTIAGTLERADPRDVLLIRRTVVDARPASLAVLSSSPRRAWQMGQSLAPLLPWPCGSIAAHPVRGNIPTRLRKLLAGDGDALVVAKAALDRLLSPDSKPDVARDIRNALGQCAWMVLPLRQFPTAPAQGALAIEIAASRTDLADRVQAVTHEPTRLAVEAERAILASYGGGCHEAIGATVLLREYGRITSLRGQLPNGEVLQDWSLTRSGSATVPPRTDASHVWPGPDERQGAERRPLSTAVPAHARALWIARADALPLDYRPSDSQLVWTAGLRSWERLARRGVWVHGSSDGLGDQESPDVDLMAGTSPEWIRLTHDRSDAPGALATYSVRYVLPDDLAARTHFFWMSGSLFREALDRHPGIGGAWHASGPGRTARALHDTLGSTSRVSTWLDYDQWHQNVTL
ncbi:MAG: hydroxymethylbilane synthase [Vicinamibacterales bacterium]